MNDDDGGGEVARAFFSSLGKCLLSLSHTLSLNVCLSPSIARTHRSVTQKLPAAPLTNKVTTKVSLLLVEQLYYNYYYNKILLSPLPPLAN